MAETKQPTTPAPQPRVKQNSELRLPFSVPRLSFVTPILIKEGGSASLAQNNSLGGFFGSFSPGDFIPT